jgi:hypothetical protein
LRPGRGESKRPAGQLGQIRPNWAASLQSAKKKKKKKRQAWALRAAPRTELGRKRPWAESLAAACLTTEIPFSYSILFSEAFK